MEGSHFDEEHDFVSNVKMEEGPATVFSNEDTTIDNALQFLASDRPSIESPGRLISRIQPGRRWSEASGASDTDPSRQSRHILAQQPIPEDVVMRGHSPQHTLLQGFTQDRVASPGLDFPAPRAAEHQWDSLGSMQVVSGLPQSVAEHPVAIPLTVPSASASGLPSGTSGGERVGKVKILGRGGGVLTQEVEVHWRPGLDLHDRRILIVHEVIEEFGFRPQAFSQRLIHPNVIVLEGKYLQSGSLTKTRCMLHPHSEYRTWIVESSASSEKVKVLARGDVFRTGGIRCEKCSRQASLMRGEEVHLSCPTNEYHNTMFRLHRDRKKEKSGADLDNAHNGLATLIALGARPEGPNGKSKSRTCARPTTKGTSNQVTFITPMGTPEVTKFCHICKTYVDVDHQEGTVHVQTPKRSTTMVVAAGMRVITVLSTAGYSANQEIELGNDGTRERAVIERIVPPKTIQVQDPLRNTHNVGTAVRVISMPKRTVVKKQNEFGLFSRFTDLPIEPPTLPPEVFTATPDEKGGVLLSPEVYSPVSAVLREQQQDQQQRQQVFLQQQVHQNQQLLQQRQQDLLLQQAAGRGRKDDSTDSRLSVKTEDGTFQLSPLIGAGQSSSWIPLQLAGLSPQQAQYQQAIRNASTSSLQPSSSQELLFPSTTSSPGAAAAAPNGDGHPNVTHVGSGVGMQQAFMTMLQSQQQELSRLEMRSRRAQLSAHTESLPDLAALGGSYRDVPPALSESSSRVIRRERDVDTNDYDTESNAPSAKRARSVLSRSDVPAVGLGKLELDPSPGTNGVRKVSDTTTTLTQVTSLTHPSTKGPIAGGSSSMSTGVAGTGAVADNGVKSQNLSTSFTVPSPLLIADNSNAKEGMVLDDGPESPALTRDAMNTLNAEYSNSNLFHAQLDQMDHEVNLVREVDGSDQYAMGRNSLPVHQRSKYYKYSGRENEATLIREFLFQGETSQGPYIDARHVRIIGAPHCGKKSLVAEVVGGPEFAHRDIYWMGRDGQTLQACFERLEVAPDRAQKWGARRLKILQHIESFEVRPIFVFYGLDDGQSAYTPRNADVIHIIPFHLAQGGELEQRLAGKSELAQLTNDVARTNSMHTIRVSDLSFEAAREILCREFLTQLQITISDENGAGTSYVRDLLAAKPLPSSFAVSTAPGDKDVPLLTSQGAATADVWHLVTQLVEISRVHPTVVVLLGTSLGTKLIELQRAHPDTDVRSLVHHVQFINYISQTLTNPHKIGGALFAPLLSALQNFLVEAESVETKPYTRLLCLDLLVFYGEFTMPIPDLVSLPGNAGHERELEEYLTRLDSLSVIRFKRDTQHQIPTVSFHPLYRPILRRLMMKETKRYSRCLLNAIQIVLDQVDMTRLSENPSSRSPFTQAFVNLNHGLVYHATRWLHEAVMRYLQHSVDDEMLRPMIMAAAELAYKIAQFFTITKDGRPHEVMWQLAVMQEFLEVLPPSRERNLRLANIREGQGSVIASSGFRDQGAISQQVFEEGILAFREGLCSVGVGCGECEECRRQLTAKELKSIILLHHNLTHSLYRSRHLSRAFKHSIEVIEFIDTAHDVLNSPQNNKGEELLQAMNMLATAHRLAGCVYEAAGNLSLAGTHMRQAIASHEKAREHPMFWQVAEFTRTMNAFAKYNFECEEFAAAQRCYAQVEQNLQDAEGRFSGRVSKPPEYEYAALKMNQTVVGIMEGLLCPWYRDGKLPTGLDQTLSHLGSALDAVLHRLAKYGIPAAPQTRVYIPVPGNEENLYFNDSVVVSSEALCNRGLLNAWTASFAPTHLKDASTVCCSLGLQDMRAEALASAFGDLRRAIRYMRGAMTYRGIELSYMNLGLAVVELCIFYKAVNGLTLSNSTVCEEHTHSLQDSPPRTPDQCRFLLNLAHEAALRCLRDDRMCRSRLPSGDSLVASRHRAHALHTAGLSCLLMALMHATYDTKDVCPNVTKKNSMAKDYLDRSIAIQQEVFGPNCENRGADVLKMSMGLREMVKVYMCSGGDDPRTTLLRVVEDTKRYVLFPQLLFSKSSCV